MRRPTISLLFAVGVALANAYRQSKDLVAVFFGDGALEEGSFWESLNFACLRRLRTLFVCEDNGLAIHTPASERQGFRSLEQAVGSFHCHVAGGNGSNLEEVIRLTRHVLDRMLDQPKPGFLHLSYYRFLEHVGPREDFDAGYRRRPTPEESAQSDPVLHFEHSARQCGVSAEELMAVRMAVDEQINRSVQGAQNAPFPPPSELHTDLFA